MIRDEDKRIEGEVSERLSAEVPVDAAQIQVEVTHSEVALRHGGYL